MSRLLRIELLKLRTVRTTFGLLATAAALTALFASIEAARAGNATSGVKSLATAAGLTTVTTVTGWSMLFAGVLGVVLSSGEFRHSSATLTYLATPNRVRVLIAKTLAAASAGAIFGLAATVIATGVGLTFVASHGYPVALAAGTMIDHGAGTILGAALLAAVGVGLGSLIRSQLAAVIAVFVWGIVIESVIGGLLHLDPPLPPLHRRDDAWRDQARQCRLRPRPRRSWRSPASLCGRRRAGRRRGDPRLRDRSAHDAATRHHIVHAP
jgi:ABC-type transport system involved in multi-copper enzyme maturation permease subunit